MRFRPNWPLSRWLWRPRHMPIQLSHGIGDRIPSAHCVMQRVFDLDPVGDPDPDANYGGG